MRRGGFYYKERRISILCKNIPKYELLVRTQKIFNGWTIVSAWIDGEMSTSHHSSIVAQYHHSRTKLYILAMDLIASTAAAASKTKPAAAPVENKKPAIPKPTTSAPRKRYDRATWDNAPMLTTLQHVPNRL